MVLTIHDLGMLDEGKAAITSLAQSGQFWLDWPLRSCDRLRSPSPSGPKDDILYPHAHSPADRIAVIPSVVSPTFRAAHQRPLTTP